MHRAGGFFFTFARYKYYKMKKTLILLLILASSISSFAQAGNTAVEDGFKNKNKVEKEGWTTQGL